MRLVWTEEKCYLIAPRGIEMNRILEAVSNHTGMRKNSFADLEVKRIFSNLFCGAMELTSIYEKYYSEEYDSFREFLYQKETLEYPSIDLMHLQEHEALWELRYEISSYHVRDLMGYKGEGIVILNQFLERIL